VTEIEAIRAEGIAYGPEAREASLNAALEEARGLRAA
jgi:FMN-dependent NADH-azoreductase